MRLRRTSKLPRLTSRWAGSSWTICAPSLHRWLQHLPSRQQVIQREIILNYIPQLHTCHAVGSHRWCAYDRSQTHRPRVAHRLSLEAVLTGATGAAESGGDPSPADADAGKRHLDSFTHSRKSPWTSILICSHACTLAASSDTRVLHICDLAMYCAHCSRKGSCTHGKSGHIRAGCLAVPNRR